MFASHSDERWEGAWAADLELLRSLEEHGDCPSVSRPIDVTFSGSAVELDRLAGDAGRYGFDVLDRHAPEPGEEPRIVLVRTQTADTEAIRELTRTYLAIEDAFDVDCEGWGCDAQTA